MIEQNGGEEAIQNELNTLHNKNFVWDKISQGIGNAGYSSSVQQCRVKPNNLKQKYRKICDGDLKIVSAAFEAFRLA